MKKQTAPPRPRVPARRSPPPHKPFPAGNTHEKHPISASFHLRVCPCFKGKSHHFPQLLPPLAVSQHTQQRGSPPQSVNGFAKVFFATHTPISPRPPHLNPSFRQNPRIPSTNNLRKTVGHRCAPPHSPRCLFALSSIIATESSADIPPRRTFPSAPSGSSPSTNDLKKTVGHRCTTPHSPRCLFALSSIIATESSADSPPRRTFPSAPSGPSPSTNVLKKTAGHHCTLPRSPCRLFALPSIIATESSADILPRQTFPSAPSGTSPSTGRSPHQRIAAR